METETGLRETASTANTVSIRRPCGVVVSAQLSRRDRNPAPLSATRASVLRRSRVDRARRSRRVTRSKSPLPSDSRIRCSGFPSVMPFPAVGRPSSDPLRSPAPFHQAGPTEQLQIQDAGCRLPACCRAVRPRREALSRSEVIQLSLPKSLPPEPAPSARTAVHGKRHSRRWRRG